MVRDSLKSFVLTGTLAFLIGCQQEEGVLSQALPEDLRDTVTKPQEFYKNPSGYAGHRIVVRGFLAPLSGGLAVYPTEDAARAAAHHEGAFYVNDTSPRKMLRKEGTYYEPTCTGHYVELGGLVGILPNGSHGIATIDFITKYSDETFGGDGDLCYSSYDPRGYHPSELDRERGRRP